MTCEMVKWAIVIMEGNAAEARKYALKAHELREKNRMASDWCREMASAHLGFDTSGGTLVKKMMDECRAADKSERMEGRLEVWADRHAEIVKACAETKAMLDGIK